MILIVLVYIAIALSEWGYVRRHKRKKRTYIILFSTMAVLLTLSEVLYISKNTFQLSDWIGALFGPLDHWVIGK